MGPNGSGKSTLARALSGHPEYEVTGGEVLYEGKDLLDMDPEERAREGVFMAFQYPVEIPGVNNAYFLKAALNAMRKHRGQPELDAMEFMQLVQEKVEAARDRQVDAQPRGQRGVLGRREEAQRDLPDGGARAEAGDPRRDRLGPRHRRAEARRRTASTRMRSPERACIVVTHYQRLLNYIVPDFVHVLSGRPDREVGRQGAGAGARGRRATAGGSMTAVTAAHRPEPPSSMSRTRHADGSMTRC